MLSWIPLLGPIIDGIVSIFTKVEDTDLGKYKVDGEVFNQSTQSATLITLAFQHDIPVRLARDMIMFPGSAWCGLYIWDKIVEHRYPWLVWVVHPLDGPMIYLPYALMTFFFGMSYLTWKNK